MWNSITCFVEQRLDLGEIIGDLEKMSGGGKHRHILVFTWKGHRHTAAFWSQICFGLCLFFFFLAHSDRCGSRPQLSDGSSFISLRHM